MHLNRGAHIRVSMLAECRRPEGAPRALDIWCFAIASGLGWYFSYYATKATYWSWKFQRYQPGPGRDGAVDTPDRHGYWQH